MENNNNSVSNAELKEITGGNAKKIYVCELCGEPYWGCGFVVRNTETLKYVTLGLRCEKHCREALAPYLSSGWTFVQWL